MSSLKTISTALAMIAFAVTATPRTAAAQIEVEVDPIAYALSGHSLHVAKVFGALRLNVGTFGLDIPQAFHGNEGWNSTMRGAGVKLDYVGGSSDGLFAGVEGGFMRNDYALDGVAEVTERDIIGAGVRAGYRLPLGGRGLYVVPWVGVSYNFNGNEVVVSGEMFERSAITVFPTVHVGWRF